MIRAATLPESGAPVDNLDIESICASGGVQQRSETAAMPALRPALAALAVALTAPAVAANEPPARAVTVFGGTQIANVWEDVFIAPWDIEFEDAHLVGIAGALRVAEPIRGLAVEVEVQLVRHFGDQDHWELNAPILTARWSRFPWSERLDTSAAFGLGMSFASEVPDLEKELEGDSSAVLPYWMIEIDSELPVEDWRLVGRLHHRSPAFGLFGEDGGSNALVLGLRRQF
jgi:hypothetical protein